MCVWFLVHDNDGFSSRCTYVHVPQFVWQHWSLFLHAPVFFSISSRNLILMWRRHFNWQNKCMWAGLTTEWERGKRWEEFLSFFTTQLFLALFSTLLSSLFSPSNSRVRAHTHQTMHLCQAAEFLLDINLGSDKWDPCLCLRLLNWHTTLVTDTFN